VPGVVPAVWRKVGGKDQGDVCALNRRGLKEGNPHFGLGTQLNPMGPRCHLPGTSAGTMTAHGLTEAMDET
jgi:hypothetical protein